MKMNDVKNVLKKYKNACLCTAPAIGFGGLGCYSYSNGYMVATALSLACGGLWWAMAVYDYLDKKRR